MSRPLLMHQPWFTPHCPGCDAPFPLPHPIVRGTTDPSPYWRCPDCGTTWER